MEEVFPLAAYWNEWPIDLQTEILAQVPVEFVYKYRIICKQWNDLLSSNYFITHWTEASVNRKQPRLVLCDRNPKMPCMAFCFHTRTWIKSCFNFSFLEDWIPQICNRIKGIHCTQSVAGLILVRQIRPNTICGRVCNPYTRKFVQIPAPHTEPYVESMVVDENDNGRLDLSYKVVAVGNAQANAIGVRERQIVEIYEHSQNRWNMVTHVPEYFLLHLDSELVFCNGSLYAYCQTAEDEKNGIVSFTLGTSAVVSMPNIHFVFIPFPEIVQSRNRFNDHYVLPAPRLITCGSRLLLIAAKNRCRELVIIMWEFENEEGGPKWVEITRMPSFLFREWMNKLSSNYGNGYFLWDCCVGVGDHVCFVTSPYIAPSKVVEVVDYNLRANTWNWLPSAPTSHRCVGEKICHGGFYKSVAFEPRPHMKVE